MPDKQLLLEFALDAFDRLTSIIASLDDVAANADLGVPGCRTPYQILAACLDAVRDDPAGVRDASGPVGPLLEDAAGVRAALLGRGDPARDLLALAGEFSRHLGHLEATRDVLAAGGRVRQLRLVVEADDFERAVGFYRDVVGLREAATFVTAGVGDARGVLLDAGRATLELNTPAQKRAIDIIEVGHGTDAPIRVALQVPDVERLTNTLVDAGALVIAPAVTTPWNSVNARLQAPGGLELTVFQEL